MARPPPLEDDMTRRLFLFLASMLPLSAQADLQVVVIEGLGGDAQYETQFRNQVEAIGNAARGLTSAGRIEMFRSGEYDREDLLDFFNGLSGDLDDDDRLAIFLVGHGSFDDHEYKFNIAGPDLSDTDLREILDGATAGNLLLVNMSSASGATADRLKGDGRTLILATRSGAERHATRFGGYFVAALSDPAADLDKNNIITGNEAHDFAARQVSDFFERNGRLATEHSRVEGDQAARFSLARLGSQRPAATDPELERLVAERDALNAAIDDLRLRRDDMAADAYQAELLNRMLELATLEEDIEEREAELSNEN